MRLTLEVEGDVYEVDVGREGADFEVVCGQKRLRARVERDPWSVRLGDSSHRVEFASDAEAAVDGRPLAFRLIGFEAGPSLLDALSGGRVAVRAMMPGRLVKVLAAAGTVVARGDAIFVLEAMKMQNELLSPASGRVVDIEVKEGDVVEVGRVLAQLEPAAAPDRGKTG